MTEQDRSFVLEPAAVSRLEPYGIPYPDHRVAHSYEEAMSIADELGYPVVLKIVSAQIPHKTEVDGVRVNLMNRDQVRQGFRQILTAAMDASPCYIEIEGVLVCKQAPDGLEVIVGASEDPVFGMTIMFGLGGIFTEVLKDVSFRSVPLDHVDALEMIQEIKGYPVLKGARGKNSCDVEALAELLVGVSHFVCENQDVKELDLNPVRVYPNGVQALDARILSKVDPIN